MGVKRRRAKRRCELSESEENWLRGEGGGFVQFMPEEALRELWTEHRDRIIAEHVAESPGSRPLRWWNYDSPDDERGEDEDEAAYLKRRGLLFEGELSVEKAT